MSLLTDLPTADLQAFHDRIRVAPTYPELADIEQASEGIALSILLGVSEKLLSERMEPKAAKSA